jgi:hypothetical protein
MSTQWWHTRMGQDFLTVHVPKMAKQLERIADALEKQNQIMEQYVQSTMSVSESELPDIDDIQLPILHQYEVTVGSIHNVETHKYVTTQPNILSVEKDFQRKYKGRLSYYWIEDVKKIK